MKKILIFILALICLTFTTSADTTKKDVAKTEKTAEKKEEKKKEVQEEAGLPYVVDGVEITKIGIEVLGETPNFMLYLANTTDKEKTFDLTKFDLVNVDEVHFVPSKDKQELKASQPYSQSASPIVEVEHIMNTAKIAVGETIAVFYDGVKVCDVETTEF